MSDSIVSVSHALTQDEALRRIQAAVAQAREQYTDRINELRESWNGYAGEFVVSAMGQKISGTVAVNPSDVMVQTKLPFLAMAFKPMIESGLREELAKILA
jgi:hypothetical protein